MIPIQLKHLSRGTRRVVQVVVKLAGLHQQFFGVVFKVLYLFDNPRLFPLEDILVLRVRVPIFFANY